MENFVFAILYSVYFALKCMYFEDLWVKSCEVPKMRTTYGMQSSFLEIRDRSSKYMYLRAKYTKYKMAKTKFSIWRYVICEICKKNGSNRPFLASRVADTIFPPPYRRSPPLTRQSMQRPNEQQQRLSSWAINQYIAILQNKKI